MGLDKNMPLEVVRCLWHLWTKWWLSYWVLNHIVFKHSDILEAEVCSSRTLEHLNTKQCRNPKDCHNLINVEACYYQLLCHTDMMSSTRQLTVTHWSVRTVSSTSVHECDRYFFQLRRNTTSD